MGFVMELQSLSGLRCRGPAMTRSIIPMETKHTPTVAVWTPWGAQSVPKQERQANELMRLTSRLSLPKPQTKQGMQA